jgi:pilus assembly protein CpaB
MKKRGSLLIISILCAMATTYLIYLFLQEKVREASPTEPTRTVIVAATKIAPYTKITSSMVKPMQVHWNSVHPQALTDMNQAVGMVSLETFVPEQVLLQPLLSKPEGSNLFAMQIPEGMRAMSIPYSQVKGAGGLISPGDKVDILVAYNKDALKLPHDIVKVTLQNIQVLAVGQEREKELEETSEPVEKPNGDNRSSGDQEGQARSTITLAVTPQQAEALGFAESFGDVRLLLRAPQDKKNVSTTGVQTNTALSR